MVPSIQQEVEINVYEGMCVCARAAVQTRMHLCVMILPTERDWEE